MVFRSLIYLSWGRRLILLSWFLTKIVSEFPDSVEKVTANITKVIVAQYHQSTIDKTRKRDAKGKREKQKKGWRDDVDDENKGGNEYTGQTHHHHTLVDIFGHDILTQFEKTEKEGKVYCLDIGTGASAIFSLLASRVFSWNCLATDINPASIHHAESNVNANTRKLTDMSRSDVNIIDVIDTADVVDVVDTTEVIDTVDVRDTINDGDNVRHITQTTVTNQELSTPLSIYPTISSNDNKMNKLNYNITSEYDWFTTSSSCPHPDDQLSTTQIELRLVHKDIDMNKYPILKGVLRGFDTLPSTFLQDNGLEPYLPEAREISETFQLSVCNPPFFSTDRLLSNKSIYGDIDNSCGTNIGVNTDIHTDNDIDNVNDDGNNNDIDIFQDTYVVGSSKRRKLEIQPQEACFPGGEVAFITQYIDECIQNPTVIQWHTTMLGLVSSINPIIEYLQSLEVLNRVCISMSESSHIHLMSPILERLEERVTAESTSTKKSLNEEDNNPKRSRDMDNTGLKTTLKYKINYPLIIQYTFQVGKQTRYALGWSFCPILYSTVLQYPVLYSKLLQILNIQSL